MDFLCCFKNKTETKKKKKGRGQKVGCFLWVENGDNLANAKIGLVEISKKLAIL